MKKLTTMMMAVLLLCAMVRVKAAVYQVTNIGPYNTWATAINNSGEVTGYGLSDIGCPQGWQWRNGSVWNLTGWDRLPNAINDSGQAVGHLRFGPQDPVYTCVWQNGGYSLLWTGGDAMDINRNGVVAGYYPDAWNHPRACTMSNGTLTSLGVLEPMGSWAMGINDSGDVCGYYLMSPSSATSACIWKNGATVELGEGAALCINNSGQVAIYRNGGTYLWQAGVTQYLGAFCPMGMNRYGEVVGNTSNGYAVAWFNGELITLGTGEALDVNDNGVIAGRNGLTAQACFWTPVPEPSSLMALLCGVGGLCGVVLRKRR